MTDRELLLDLAEQLAPFLQRWSQGHRNEDFEREPKRWENSKDREEFGSELSKPAVCDYVGASEFRVIEGWIDAGYFPGPHRWIGEQPKWSMADLIRWETWRSAKTHLMTYAKWNAYYRRHPDEEKQTFV